MQLVIHHAIHSATAVMIFKMIITIINIVTAYRANTLIIPIKRSWRRNKERLFKAALVGS